jgi:hypothetical protein
MWIEPAGAGRGDDHEHVALEGARALQLGHRQAFPWVTVSADARPA